MGDRRRFRDWVVWDVIKGGHGWEYGDGFPMGEDAKEFMEYVQKLEDKLSKYTNLEDLLED